MRKLLAVILLFLASPTYAQVAQNQILPSVYFGDGVVVSTSTSPTAKLGAMATSSLGLPTFQDLLSYLTLSAWYATTTDALDEGSTNLYYTNGRVQTFLDSIAKGYFFATTSADYWLTTKSTSNLTEGSNLYYTEARVQAELLDGDNAVFGNSTTTNATTTNLSVSTAFNFLGTVITNVSTWFNGLFDTRFATKTTTDLTEGTNLYYTLTRWASALAGTTTDALAEGSTNKYYTDARVASYVSASTTIAKGTPTLNNVLLGDGTNWTSVAKSSLGFLSSAITSLNGLTGATQTFATSSTAGGWGFSSSGTTHTLTIPNSSATVLGLLTPTDWSTFNGKQPAGNYITALTGDVTASGPGSVTATLATVNSSVGTFGSATKAPTFTVNGKGLITAASENTVTPAVGSITGLGTGVATALGVNVGTTGAFVVNGGALGTPSSGTATNLTGLPLTAILGGTTGQTLYYNGTNWTATSTITVASNMNVGFGTSVTTLGNYLFKGNTAGSATSLLLQSSVDATTTDSVIRMVGYQFPTGAISAGMYFNEAGGEAGYKYNNISTAVYGANGNTEVPFIIKTATEKMRIEATTGNVGIGDATPASLLTVGNGDLFQVDSSGRTFLPAGASGAGNLALSSTGDTDTGLYWGGSNELRFQTGGTDRMMIGSNGRIGVGTVLPTQVFDIETNENANSIFLLKNASSTAASAAGVIRVSGDTALTQVIAHGSGRTISRYGITLGGWSEIAPSAGNGMILGTINATPLVFGTASNATEAMRITTGNFIGIGTTTPAWLVSIQSASDTNILALKDSDGQCLHNPESASETVTCSSDVKLKKNISDYDKALDYLNVYKVRKYTVKASGDTLVGAIAQEVQKVHPETVRDMKDGTLGVDIPSPWILVAGIQELNALHEQDVARITELENRVKALDGKDATPPVPVESKIPWASVATVVGGLGAGFVGSKIGKKK